MKNSPYESLSSVTNYCTVPVRLTVWLAALVILSPGATTLQAQSISDNFNDQTDSGAQGNWTHYDLGYWTFTLSGQQIAYGTAHFTFPTNAAGPTGNYAYRIQVDPILTDPIGIGAARAASFRADAQYGGAPYSVRFVVGADLVAWNPATLDQDVGMLFMVNPASIGPGQTAGYAATYQASDSTLYLSTITAEAPATIGEQPVPLDPTHQYRLVVSTHDESIYAEIAFRAGALGYLMKGDALDRRPGVRARRRLFHALRRRRPGRLVERAGDEQRSGSLDQAGAYPPTRQAGRGRCEVGELWGDILRRDHLAYVLPGNSQHIAGARQDPLVPLPHDESDSPGSGRALG